MQTWAKRGFQTALVTGGLLMLGTGIASAQENVNPDSPPNPLDAKVRVPVDVANNNLGTPAGNRDLPTIHREVDTEDVRRAVPVNNPLVRGAHDRLSAVDTSAIQRGNQFDGDIVAPIHACGNAIGAGGDAHAEGECTQSTPSTGGVRTDGSNQSLAGNVLAAHSATPVGVTGNAVGAGANAYSESAVRQDARTGGDIRTTGSDSSLSGNVAAVQQATPVRVSNNAIAGGGIANSTSRADSEAASGGTITTNGDRGSLGGNAVAAPLAPIVSLDGNAIGAAGNADIDADNSSTATAGGTQPNRNNASPWLDTSGENATGAGNVLQPQLAGPISVGDNAVGGVGNADAVARTDNDAQAGGWSRTRADDSTLSGNFVDGPVALPVGGAGNAVAGLGNTSASHDADTDATAGGSTYTRADRSTLSGNSANAAPAGAVDLCGNGVTGGGIAGATCENDVDSSTGGYNGTTGNDSVLSGNLGQAPAGLPVEGFGNAVGVAGTAAGTADEDKTIRAGGAPNARDDNGTVSSNVVSAPTVLGGQVFGNADGVVGNPTSRTDSDSAIVVGGPATATGKHGSFSGNIIDVPTSNPAQLPGNSAVVVGNGTADLDNELDSRAGGNSSSTGDEGAVAGNVLSVPQASSPQVQGAAAGVGGNVESTMDNQFTSFSGGDIKTSGNQGSVAGNGLTAQPAIAVQTFADTVTAAGNGKSTVNDESAVIAGGDQETEAWDSSLSGNLLNAPANAKPGAFGNAVTAGGLADSKADTLTLTQAGGKTDTEGRGSGTAHDVSVPVETRPTVFDVPAEVLGTARTRTADDSVQLTGEDEGDAAQQVKAAPQGINLPVGVDSLMGPTEMPSLSSLDRLSGLGALDLQSLLNLDVSKLTGAAPLQQLGLAPRSGLLPDLSNLPVNKLPKPDQLGALAVGDLAPAQLPVAGDLGQGLPKAALPNAALPKADLSKGLPKADLRKAGLPKADPRDAGLPKAKLPKADLHKLGLPEAKLPNLDVRKADLSKADVRQARLPKADLRQAELPQAKLPKADLRKVHPRDAKLPGVQLPTVKLPSAQLPDAPEIRETVEVVTGEEERSFGGTLPLLGGTIGFTPVIQGVLPLPGTQRSLPGLATPLPLPVVVPVPGVAQPRSAVPTLSGASLSGLNVNPLAGKVQGPKELAEERTSAPALAGLDAASMFGGLLGSADTTAVLPKI